MKAFSVRCTEDQLRRWSNAAMAQGITRQEWVVRLLDAELNDFGPWEAHSEPSLSPEEEQHIAETWPDPAPEIAYDLGPDRILTIREEQDVQGGPQVRTEEPVSRETEVAPVDSPGDRAAQSSSEGHAPACRLHGILPLNEGMAFCRLCFGPLV